MAWLDVHIVEDGELQETWERDGTVRASVPVVYYVEADAPVTLDAMLLASFDDVTIPALRSSFSLTRPNCRCRSRKVERISPTQGQVTCEYSDPTDGSATATLAAKPARISRGTESHAEGYHVDAEGNKVVNAAGEAFDQLPERQAGVRVYTLKKFVTTAVCDAIDAAWNTNNNAAKTIQGRTWQADELWLYDCSFESVDDSGLWDATVVIKAKVGGWKDIIPNIGYREKNGRRIKLRDTGAGVVLDYVNGEEPDKPWPLQANGEAFGPSEAATSIIPLEFWPYTRHAWTDVPLT